MKPQDIKDILTDLVLDRKELAEKLGHLATDSGRMLNRLEGGKIPEPLGGYQLVFRIDQLIERITIKEDLVTKLGLRQALKP